MVGFRFQVLLAIWEVDSGAQRNPESLQGMFIFEFPSHF